MTSYSAFIPTVNNAFQFASIIHWISLAILSVFFTEVSLFFLPLNTQESHLQLMQQNVD